MARLITHQNLDLDAVYSLIAAKLYIPKAQKAEICFRPANWDGAEMKEEDVAVDIHAGGKGIKGEKETTEDGNTIIHSCFSYIMKKFAPEIDQMALKYLIKYIDLQDSRGHIVKILFPEASDDSKNILYFSSISSILRSFQALYHNDLIVYKRMTEIFQGQLIVGRNRLSAEKLAKNAKLFGKEVALTINLPPSTHNILFDQGIKIVVFVDGNNLGIRRENNCEFRCDHPVVRNFVLSFGEKIGNAKDHWFAHESGFLFARGTSKAPARDRSKVPPNELAELVATLI